MAERVAHPRKSSDAGVAQVQGDPDGLRLHSHAGPGNRFVTTRIRTTAQRHDAGRAPPNTQAPARSGFGAPESGLLGLRGGIEVEHVSVVSVETGEAWSEEEASGHSVRSRVGRLLGRPCRLARWPAWRGPWPLERRDRRR